MKQPKTNVKVSKDTYHKDWFVDMTDPMGWRSTYICLARGKTRLSALRFAERRLMKHVREIRKRIEKEER